MSESTSPGDLDCHNITPIKYCDRHWNYRVKVHKVTRVVVSTTNRTLRIVPVDPTRKSIYTVQKDENWCVLRLFILVLNKREKDIEQNRCRLVSSTTSYEFS